MARIPPPPRHIKLIDGSQQNNTWTKWFHDEWMRTSQGSTNCINAIDEGARGDGVSDDTIALQNAIAKAERNRQDLFIPAGNPNTGQTYEYFVSDTLDWAVGIRIRGERGTKIVVDSSLAGTKDVFAISPLTTTGDVNQGYTLEDIWITPESGTPGRHAVSIDITSRAAYNILIHRCRFDQLGGNAIRTLPNATPIADGFFTSVIRQNILYGGVYLDEAGDSIRIENNVITGTGIGVYAYLVDTGSDGGAHGLEIVGNNITCSGGSISIENAHQGCLRFNNMEIVGSETLTNNAAVSIDGDATAPTSPKRGVKGFTILGNHISSSAGNDTIYLGLCYDVTVMCNYVSRKAGQFSYVVSSSAINASLLWNNDALEEAKSSFLSDSGNGTLWIRNFGGALETTLPISYDQTEITITDHPYTPVGDALIVADTVGGNITINLPSGINNRQIIIKHAPTGGANALTVVPNGAETIQGAATLVIAAGAAFTLVYNSSRTDHLIIHGST